MRRWNLSRRYVVARCGLLRFAPWRPSLDAGETANPIAPNAYNYVISLQRRSRELKHPVDLPADFASLGYQQLKCWTDPYDRTMLMERMCLWRRPGCVIPHRASHSLRKSERLLRS